MRPIIEWMSRQEIEGLYSAAYWNDIETEKLKPTWTTDGNATRLLDYLSGSGLLQEFELVIEHLKRMGLLQGRVIDLGAGVCWTSALLSKFDEISAVDAVEFSWHRLNDVAPNVCAALGAKEDKISRLFASFYDLTAHVVEPYDLVFLSQAFHHASEPRRLLAECDAILKRSGAIVLVGEAYVTLFDICRRTLRRLLTNGELILEFERLFPPDRVLGDHYYRLKDYRAMFHTFGFDTHYIKSNIEKAIIVIATRRPT